MAYIIASGIVDPKTGANLGGGYLKVKSFQVDHTNKRALVKIELYANQAARTNNLASLNTFENKILMFSDKNTKAPYTPVFESQPATGSTSAVNNVLTQIYTALPSHPDMAPYLAGATAATA